MLNVKSQRLTGAVLRALSCEALEWFALATTKFFEGNADDPQLPSVFRQGNVVLLYKAGESANPANYRPISLLSSEYKLLSRIVERRLRSVLLEADVMSRAQACRPGSGEDVTGLAVEVLEMRQRVD